jgi:hypothetical protein
MRAGSLQRLSRPLLTALAAALLLLALAGASPAFAAGSWWHLSSGSAPTNLPPGGEGQVIATASNLGYEDAKATTGDPIKISDKLPPGLEVIPGKAKAYAPGPKSIARTENGIVEGNSLECEVTGSVAAGQRITCKMPTPVAPYGDLEIVAGVKVNAAEGAALLNTVELEGGEGSNETAPLVRPLKVAGATTQFGVETYELTPEEEAGSPATQAGVHPFQLTTTLALNQVLRADPGREKEEGAAPALARDLHFVLPPGLLGNVTVLPQCPTLAFSTVAEGDINLCEARTAIGVARVTFNEPNNFGGVATETVPVFNLEPAPGEPARFGFEFDKVPIALSTAVRTGSDYAVEVSALNASQAADVLGTQVTFWGTPGDPRHDAARGWECVDDERYKASERGKPCEPLGETTSPPFLSLPTSCTAAPVTTVTGDSWPFGPAHTVSELGSENTEYKFPTGLSGCELLGFEPTISVAPDTARASTPTGLTVKVHLPQESTLSPTGHAEADLKETVVALPQGVQASPGAANGLTACSAFTPGFGFEGDKLGLVESDQLLNEHISREGASCPETAKIGTMVVKTPLLKKPLEGGVYIAEQDTNLVEQRLVLYLTAYDPESGVRVKLAGDVHVDPGTGQLTSTFKNSPQVPFEDLTLNFFGGGTASQATPALCGIYATQASFGSWSSPAPVSGSSSFSITEGAGGSACQTQTPQSFGPSFQAGTVNNAAGVYSPFSLTIGHPDADQPLTGVTTKLPPGAAAMLSSITPCPEPPVGQEWNCGANSLIGKSASSSGFGSSPYTLAGQVYLTTGYDGAPFGLLVSTNAEHAGPFNLGVINVRSRINVDKTTAAVTITTDPGPRNEFLPTMIKGLPVDLKQINVTVDRPNFEFNPTNCTPMSVTGTLSGSQGAAANVSSPFTVTNCASLPFKPKLTASTQGNATKANGASLTVRVESSPGQANIAKTKLVLPITLPSRLTTIQKACLDSVFEVNPAACDEGSNIGTAIVHTPVLKNPLIGPAYLVSHGGAAFPDIEFVLQGEGITLILDGQTDIKKGITTSTFNTVPDAPVTVFETKLPEGPHSALTSNVAESKKFNLCGAKLTIPTTITGQNGVVVQQETKVPVEGCAVVKGFKVTRAQQLSKALKACRKEFKHSKKKRAACEKKAQKKYGAKKKAKKKSAKKSKKK